MAVTINASTSTGVGITSDTSGQIVLQTNGSNTVVFPTSGTVTLAAQTGTLNAAGPAFSAYGNTQQTVTLSTFTKVTLDGKDFDTNNCFDAVTNYRFTPTVAGYYQINGQVWGKAATTQTVIISAIYKNGSEIKRGSLYASITAAAGLSYPVNTVVYLNGSTDYIELYGFIGGSGTANINNSGSTTNTSFFSACLVRGA